MIFTNRHNLPENVARALSYDGYDKVGDISVTGLLRPPQIAYLEEQHTADIEEDISDRIWQLWGSAAHEVLYRARDKDAVIAEKRLTMQVGGWEVSGKADTYDTNTQVITDFKTTSVWSVVFEPKGKPEYHEQLNLYRLLFEANGYPVKGLQLISILRDWNKKESLKRTDYPPIPIHVLDVPMVDKAKAQAFLEARVALHKSARKGLFVDCTPEERWYQPRTGEYTRCKDYCSVAKWCPTLAKERNHA